ncbi:MAG: hypothetical protein U0452_09910 [Anaerolineae bacterium]
MPASVLSPVVGLRARDHLLGLREGGVEAMGRAFVASGRIQAHHGLLTTNGSDMLVFLIHFFHGVLRKRLSDEDAMRQAIAATARLLKSTRCAFSSPA